MIKLKDLEKKWNIIELQDSIIYSENNSITIETKINKFSELEDLAKEIQQTIIYKLFNNIEIENNLFYLKDNYPTISNKVNNLRFALSGDFNCLQNLNAYLIK